MCIILLLKILLDGSGSLIWLRNNQWFEQRHPFPMFVHHCSMLVIALFSLELKALQRLFGIILGLDALCMTLDLES